ncbi:uncharacterized protein LOC9652148 [Selaginella moellendorffii]|nr:uncharacterized protein LOC9652148 [Selaginella moellendorffii]|eukprot:XP_002993030.2 uncharacterized protein LOC9652148 [Selaginella moellendorffii]
MGFLARASLWLLLAIAIAAIAAQEDHRGAFQDTGIVVIHPGFGRTLKQAPSSNSTLLLAEDRTSRHDPLDDFRRYRDGWDIRNKHYWASVGFTGLPGFILALLWAALGLLFLLSLCCYCCCCRRKDRSGSESSLVPLLLLSLLTLAAIAGCVLVYISQAKFHDELSGTLNFVVRQSQTTVDNLQNVSRTLNQGASINIFGFGLGNDERQQVLQISQQLNTTSNQLELKTEDNAHKIRRAINMVRLAMIIISAAMLLLVLLGILFAACGLQSLVYLLVILGFILVIATWILCGVFILLNNVMGDTCVAMREWVQNPGRSTNLDDILPCVNQTTANQTLDRSKEVAVSVVRVLNQAVTLVLNGNAAPPGNPLNFNQSGPTMPTLCSPYGPAPDYAEVPCASGTITLQQAPGNWSRYVCQAPTGTTCATPGRMTPQINDQVMKSVSVATGLVVNVPFLVNVENCVFVRETFQTIIRERCPGLRKYTRWIYIGLALASAGTMLSIVFWIIAARRKHRQRHRHRHAGYEKNEPGEKVAPT